MRFITLLFFIISTFLNAQVKSTKTNFFIHLQPDKMDSLIYDSTYAASAKQKQLRINQFTSVGFGFLVGTSKVSFQRTQLIGRQINAKYFTQHTQALFHYYRFNFEDQKSLTADFQYFMAGSGFHFNSENLSTQYGIKLLIGAKNKRTEKSDVWAASLESGIYFNHFLRTPYISFIESELTGNYGLNEVLISGSVSYNIELGKSILCTFNYRHLEIPYLLSSDSFGFSVSLFLFNWILVD